MVSLNLPPNWLKTWLNRCSSKLTFYLAYGIEAAAALVIAVAAAKAVVGSLLLFLQGRPPGAPDAVSRAGGGQEVVRLELGRWLALALEFELAADI
jgi:uncharacterized membrane protein